MHGGGPAGPGFTSWHARGGGGHVLGEVRAAEQMCECEPGDGAPRVSHGGVVLRRCLMAVLHRCLHGCLAAGGNEVRLGTLVSRPLDGSFLLVGYLKPRAPSLCQ